MFDDYFGSKDNESGVDLLSKGGIPEEMAIEALDSLTAYRDYNKKLFKIKKKKYAEDSEKDKEIKTNKVGKMRYLVEKKCKTMEACLDLKNCVDCGPYWCIKLKKPKEKPSDHCKRIIERGEKKCLIEKPKPKYCSDIINPKMGL